MTLDKTIYQIIVKDGLDNHWAAWFEGLTVSHDEEGCTSLTGPVTDQAALRGILNKLWDLNLTLVSVRRGVTHQSSRQAEQYQQSKEANHDH